MTKIKYFPIRLNKKPKKKIVFLLRKQRKWHFLSTFICDLRFMCYQYNERWKNSLGPTYAKLHQYKTVLHRTCCQCKNKEHNRNTETWRAIISWESCRLQSVYHRGKDYNQTWLLLFWQDLSFLFWQGKIVSLHWSRYSFQRLIHCTYTACAPWNCEHYINDASKDGMFVSWNIM